MTTATARRNEHVSCVAATKSRESRRTRRRSSRMRSSSNRHRSRMRRIR